MRVPSFDNTWIVNYCPWKKVTERWLHACWLRAAFGKEVRTVTSESVGSFDATLRRRGRHQSTQTGQQLLLIPSPGGRVPSQAKLVSQRKCGRSLEKVRGESWLVQEFSLSGVRWEHLSQPAGLRLCKPGIFEHIAQSLSISVQGSHRELFCPWHWWLGQQQGQSTHNCARHVSQSFHGR